MANTASVRELRDNLGQVLDRATYNHEVTVVTKRGREVAAVVPIELVREWERAEDEALLEIVKERMAEDTGHPGVPLADVIAETLARPE